MVLWSSYIYATAFLGLMLRMLEMLDITYTLGPLEGAISKMMTVLGNILESDTLIEGNLFNYLSVSCYVLTLFYI